MNYQLHDSQINNLSVSDNIIVLCFSQGFWETDEKGKEVSQKQNCKLIFSIDNEFNVPLDEFITIRICKRKSIYKPITLCKFVDLLKKSAFDVDMEYDCNFANRKMIQLYSNSLNIIVEFFIKEIKSVEYVHD